MKNFENWETQDLEIAFDLERIWESNLLDSWLASKTTFKSHEKEQLEEMQYELGPSFLIILAHIASLFAHMSMLY